MTIPAYSKPSLPHASPEATAFAFGAMLQREHGNDWPRLIGIATGAAMRAEREALGA